MGNYSYRNASIGCKFDAREAGYHPNKTPMPAETINASKIELGERTNGDFVRVEKKKESVAPNIMQKMPPV
jgi:hypothetical protein